MSDEELNENQNELDSGSPQPEGTPDPATEPAPETDELDDPVDEPIKDEFESEAEDFTDREKGLYGAKQRFKTRAQTAESEAAYWKGRAEATAQPAAAATTPQREELVDPLAELDEYEPLTKGQLQAHREYLEAKSEQDRQDQEAEQKRLHDQAIDEIGKFGVELVGDKFNKAISGALRKGVMTQADMKPILSESRSIQEATLKTYNLARTRLGLAPVRMEMVSETDNPAEAVATNSPPPPRTPAAGRMRRVVPAAPRGGADSLAEKMQTVRNAQTIDEIDAVLDSMPEDEFPV